MVPPEFAAAPVAIVTGGAKRLGAAFARALAADGWEVVIHHNTSRAEADALAAELGARTVAADLADPAAAEAVIAAGQGRAGLLVNSASLFEYDDVSGFTAAAWERHMAVNALAPARLIQAFAAALPPGATGLTVNLLDAKLQALNPDYFTYTVSKAALAAVTELAARAYAPRLRVAAIAPAITLVSGPQSRENFDAVHARNPLGRGVSADDLVGALRFIAATPTFTAQTVTVDAGARLMGLPRDVAYMDA